MQSITAWFRSLPLRRVTLGIGALILLTLPWRAALAGTYSWKPLGYGGGGRFTAALIDPADPRHLLIGSDVAGFFSSTDGGRRFHLGGAGLGGFAVAGLAMDGPSQLFILTDNGLFTSSDGGATTKLLSPTIRYKSRFFGSQLLVKLGDDWYVGTNLDGVFKLAPNAQGGWSITPVFGLQAKKINALVVNQGKLVAGTDEGVFTYTDGYWKQISEGLPQSRRNIMDLAVHPSGRLYALEHRGGLYAFDATRQTWQRRGPNLSSLPSQNGPPAFKAMTVSPANPDTVFIGTHPEGWPHLLLRSTDGGHTWSLINRFALTGQNDNWAKDLQSPEQIILAPDGNSGFLLDWWNVWRTADGGQSWIQVQDGLQNTVVNDIAVNPTNPDILYAAVDDNGLMVSRDGGHTWNRKMQGVLDGNAGAVTLSSHNPSLVYLLANPWQSEDTGTDKYFYLYKSLDGGETWTLFRIHDKNKGALPGYADSRGTGVVISPRDDNVVYVATNGYGIYKVDTTTAPTGPDATASNISATLPAPFLKGHGTLQVDPRTPGLLIAATQEGGVYRSEDDGGHWKFVAAPAAFLFGMARDPAHPDTLYATAAEKRLLKSTDNGRTWAWIDLPGEHPAYIAASAVTVIPDGKGGPGTLLVGTSAYDNKAAEGLYVSTDGGATFTPGPATLPGVSLGVLTPYARDGAVALAGFNGIGIFELRNGDAAGKP